jgi:hypothetical protein
MAKSLVYMNLTQKFRREMKDMSVFTGANYQSQCPHSYGLPLCNLYPCNPSDLSSLAHSLSPSLHPSHPQSQPPLQSEDQVLGLLQECQHQNI